MRGTAVSKEEGEFGPFDEDAPRVELSVVAPFERKRQNSEVRRAIGRWLVAITFFTDFFLLCVLPLLTIKDAGDYSKRVFAFALLASLLLAPTIRFGRRVARPAEIAGTVAMRVAVSGVILVSGFHVIGFEITELRLSATQLAGVTIGGMVLVLLGRLVNFKLARFVRSLGYDLEDVLIVGSGTVGAELSLAIGENPDCGLLPLGFVDRFEEPMPYPIVGVPEDLPSILRETHARHVVLAFGAATDIEMVGYVRACAVYPVQFYALPRFFELGVKSSGSGFEVDGYVVHALNRPGGSSLSWRLKRMFDIVASAIALVVLSPVMAVCAAAVKLSSPGPIFFRQERIGYRGASFEILKFRSMTVNDDSATQWAVDHDNRVTKVGAFLRKSHLDELPQVINVLRGDMSIVGPRPERPHFVRQFASEIEGYDERHRVPVGITGWAQVNGFWGDTSIEARVRLDNRYIESWSFWRDLMIGLRTIPTMLGKRR